MAYIEVRDVRDYLGISGTTDDSLLYQLIASAQAAIDAHCNRTFEATADSTRSFNAVTDTDGLTLFLDRDLVSVTTLTNGDGDTIASSDYYLIPANFTPKYAIRLKGSSGISWECDDNGDCPEAIDVAGRWAYSTSAPDDIKQACLRLVSFYYRQKDAQLTDITAIEAGVVIQPEGMPRDVKVILRPYRREFMS